METANNALNATLPHGSLIHGTHRPEDLLPILADALLSVDASDAAQTLAYDAGEATLELIRDRDDDDPQAWAVAREHAADLLVELFDALDAHAPAGHYFGAHPGDGADFGCWEHEEE